MSAMIREARRISVWELYDWLFRVGPAYERRVA